MGALISFFVFLIVSYLIVRIGSIFLKLTGLSEEVASFQARSAFSGTGYSTRESELIVGHPVRRKIIMAMMLVHNAGIVSLLSTLILSFARTTSSSQIYVRAGILLAGLFLLVLISRSRLLNRILSKIIEAALKKFTRVAINDYESLLNISGDYAIAEQSVEEDDWMADSSLDALALPREGLLVLGIRRADGHFIGAPHGETFLYGGDRVIMYGREGAIKAIGERPRGDAGDTAHEEAIERHNRLNGRKPHKGRSNPSSGEKESLPRRRNFIQRLFTRRSQKK